MWTLFVYMQPLPFNVHSVPLIYNNVTFTTTFFSLFIIYVNIGYILLVDKIRFLIKTKSSPFLHISSISKYSKFYL